MVLTKQQIIEVLKEQEITFEACVAVPDWNYEDVATRLMEQQPEVSDCIVPAEWVDKLQVNCPECGKTWMFLDAACPGCGFRIPKSYRPKLDPGVNKSIERRRLAMEWWNNLNARAREYHSKKVFNRGSMSLTGREIQSIFESFSEERIEEIFGHYSTQGILTLAQFKAALNELTK